MVMPSGMSLDLVITVVDADPATGKATLSALRGAGFDKVEQVKDLPKKEKAGPELRALVVSGSERKRLLSELGSQYEEGCCVLIACDGPEQEAEALGEAADEVFSITAAPGLIRRRIQRAFEAATQRHAFAELKTFQNALLEGRSTIATRGDGADVLREILVRAAAVLNFERGAMMAHVDGSQAAYVIAATDDPTLSQFEVAIADYPEVREAIHNGEPLLIEDVRQHAVTSDIAKDLVKRGVAAMAVFPVTWKGRSMGALLFRKSHPGVEDMSQNAQAFGTLLAAQLAAQLRDSSLFDRLRDQTRRLTRATFEAERRAHVIDSLSDYFEASPEGILVIDQRGKLIHVNGSALNLTGFTRDTLLGKDVTELLPEEQHEAIGQVIDAVFEGDNVEPIDLELKNTGGSYNRISLTTSTVLTKHGAVILSFRDVTRQRSLEAQLQHSNQFLANLIDSAVDAIIAVDMRGMVIVFNKGAEQLFGFTSEEVVGQMSVSKLYPDKVPGQVMRMLRSSSYGGVGRLEQVRREVVVRSGESVPVNMTAAMIYEDGQEVASVGIFSDLRDRIRIEQRLLQAQEQLQVQEQRSMLAELAGAAAHELNQPLTSIIGYAQLIQRTSELGARHLRYTDTIVEEADRMAEIVKKIGRITHYETVPYVGSTNIVDLNRSIEASEAEVVPAVLFEEEEATARISLEQIAETHEEEMRAPAEGVQQSRGDKNDGR
jgi:PAS domain S-box-containing protein